MLLFLSFFSFFRCFSPFVASSTFLLCLPLRIQKKNNYYLSMMLLLRSLPRCCRMLIHRFWLLLVIVYLFSLSLSLVFLLNILKLKSKQTEGNNIVDKHEIDLCLIQFPVQWPVFDVENIIRLILSCLIKIKCHLCLTLEITNQELVRYFCQTRSTWHVSPLPISRSCFCLFTIPDCKP